MPPPAVNRPIPLHQVLEEEYARLNNQAPPSLDEKASSEKRLESIFKDIHQQEHSALCLSGGGIRSATFALGVLQGLARKGLLEEFSYLSTVSGGGYVGGWLSAWIHRHTEGMTGVVDALKETATTRSKIDPEPGPVQHLRSYSNYLTPRLGMFSADAWTVAAIALRNVILNWLVLIPMLILVLMVPRLAVACIHGVPKGAGALYVVLAVLFFLLIVALCGNKLFKLWASLLLIFAYIAFVVAIWFSPLATTLLLGFAGGVMSLTYVGLKRPSATVDYNNQQGFLKWCLLPLLASAVSLTTFWAWFRNSDVDVQEQLESLKLPAWAWSIKVPHYSIPFIIFGVSLYVLGWLIPAGWMGQLSIWRLGWRSRFDIHRLYEFFAFTVSGLIAGLFLWLVATKAFPSPTPGGNSDTILYYVTFASPLYLGLFLFTAIVFAGISSEFTEDEDREWWARFSAWILIAIFSWSVLCYLSLLGPHLFEAIAAKYIVPAGGLIGFITTRLAQSASSPAKLNQEQKGGWRGLLRLYALPIGASLFIALLIILLTYLINYLLALLTLIFASVPWKPLPGTGLIGNLLLLLRESVPHGNLAGLQHKDAAMQIIRDASFPLLIVLVIVIGYFANRLSHRINTNKFSYHAMYRSRLIRAYLGASNEARFPNPFTGFDPTDNIPMYELRPEFFHPGSFQDMFRFVQRLKNGEDAISIFFRDNLSPTTLKYLQNSDEYHNPSRLLQRELIEDFNRFVQKGDSLYDDTTAFSSIEGAKKIFADQAAGLQTPDALLLSNRRLIELAFPKDIQRCPDPPQKPLHVVNIALNLVHGKKLAWQDRKAASFTVSPLHSGSCQVPDFEEEDQKLKRYGSYRRSKEYGGSGGISLGTAVAISGAAVSPNMGYYSSTLVTFLMTLFNVRLGWWLGNPGKAGRDYYKLSNPKSSAYPIVAEALGLTDDDNSYVYLSDGGHFENLGLYEMVLRRCHQIVVVDASDDSEFQFDGLGNAIRKIRVDFGIPIEFDPMKIQPRSKTARGAFCAIGHIRYSEVDQVPNPAAEDSEKKRPAPDGTLIYIKPVFYGDEPRDIYHYGQANAKFPHESTVDQWFSEEQFESYRSLGLYMLEVIAGADPSITLDDFAAKATTHVTQSQNTP